MRGLRRKVLHAYISQDKQIYTVLLCSQFSVFKKSMYSRRSEVKGTIVKSLKLIILMNVHVFLTTLKDDYTCFGDKDTLDTET